MLVGVLGELLKEVFNSGKKTTTCPPLLCGYIDERLLNIFKKTKSNIKAGKKRPFLVVHSSEKFCYLILFTTSSIKFPCKRDEDYGIQDETPSLEWKDYCKKNANCEKAFSAPASKLYKLILLNNDCHIVLQIPKRFLSTEGFVKCGIYPENEIPQKIKEIVRGELKRWEI